MASIRRQTSNRSKGSKGSQGDTYEIRECRVTERGPRQFTLARFRSVLTPEALDEAAARAQRPFDRQQLLARARERGIPVTARARHAAARRLLGELQAGAQLEPTLVHLLRRALALQDEQAPPAHLADAAEWLGRSEAARAKALRGLLRTASRVARSRAAVREQGPDGFPRFDSGEPFVAPSA